MNTTIKIGIGAVYWLFVLRIIENNFGFTIFSLNWWICIGLCLVGMIWGGISMLWLVMSREQ